MKKIRFYYSLKEHIDSDGIQNLTSFIANLQTYVINYGSEITVDKFSKVYNILLNRHYEDFIAYKDYSFEETLAENFQPNFDVSGFYKEFYEVYLSTYEKYIVLLDFYAAEKTHLLNRIGSISKNKYNDTPQNGGDFDNDEHLSTINTTTVEQDVSPLINRLDDISKLYQNVLSDWADEFKHLFIPQGVNDYE